MPPPTSGATVSIAIDHLPFRYQLSEADLKETFQRWGTVQSVQVVRDGGNDVGCVQFADPVDAQDAQKQLTGQSCTFDGRQGTLVLVMGSPFQLQNRQVPGQAGPGPVAAPLSAPSACGPGAPKNGSPVKGDGKGIAPVNGHVRPTWCCKIVVEAWCFAWCLDLTWSSQNAPRIHLLAWEAESLHPKFPTAQRIRGDGDANLEHIRTQTKCHELPEQMFLWLTSDSAENGKASLETTMDSKHPQDLLKSIYEGHQQWCETNGIGVKDVKARVIENPEILPGEDGTRLDDQIVGFRTAAGSLAAGASMGQVVPPPPNSFGPCKGSPPGKGPGPY
eukprot:g24703.t1